MNTYMKTIGLVAFSLAMIACDGDTKIVEKEVVVAGDQDLNVVGKSYGEEGVINFNFISATRVVITEFDEETTAFIAGEYNYKVNKNEVTIDLKSTFPNQSASQAVAIFNGEISSKPSGELASAYNKLFTGTGSAESYASFFELAKPFFEGRGVQVSFEKPDVPGDFFASNFDIAEDLTLIIGSEGQFLKLKSSGLLGTESGLVVDEEDQGVIDLQVPFGGL